LTILFSSSMPGYPTRTLMKKRSSCASGSGKVPWYSIGFCVAMTMKGCGRGKGEPSIETCMSLIASRSALWVLGVARFISSARTMFEKIGPSRNSNRPSFGLKVETPRMSEGRRSFVNWMRLKEAAIERESAIPRSVFPIPGTSSISRWPRAMSATMTCRTTPGFPRKTDSMFFSRAESFSAFSIRFTLRASYGPPRRRRGSPCACR